MPISEFREIFNLKSLAFMLDKNKYGLGFQANIREVVIEIPHKFHNSIIGSKGRLIRSVMDECGGVIIRFPQEGSNSDKVTIRGPKDDVDKAKKQLLELANERVSLCLYQMGITCHKAIVFKDTNIFCAISIISTMQALHGILFSVERIWFHSGSSCKTRIPQVSYWTRWFKSKKD